MIIFSDIYLNDHDTIDKKYRGKYTLVFNYSMITYLEALYEIRRYTDINIVIPEWTRLIIFDSLEDAIMFKLKMPN